MSIVPWTGQVSTQRTRCASAAPFTATRLLRNGASLAEIGDLLRHRDLNTTQIYAKIDESALRGLALPWPRR